MYVCYITGCMIGGVPAAAIVPEPKDYDKGLIFVKDTDILLSGDKWTIVVNIDLDDYEVLIDLMKSVLYAVRQRIQVYKNPRTDFFDISSIARRIPGLGLSTSPWYFFRTAPLK